MPQELDPVDPWVVERESVELIPMLVETYSASTGLWTPTTSYTVACAPVGTRPTSFAAPTASQGDTGYLVNGPTLAASTPAPSNFIGYYKIAGTPETPEKKAFTLTLS
jgi:hypothetical protein